MSISKSKITLAVIIETAHPREEDPGKSIYSQSPEGAGLVEDIRRNLFKYMLYRMVH